MAFDFLKKIFKKEEIKKESQLEHPAQADKSQPVQQIEVPVKSESVSTASQKPQAEKPLSEKTDEDLEKELMEYSPEIFSHAKTPEMRRMVINIYRKMLEDKVDINNEKEVKKWLQKHPEVAQGGEPLPRPETYKREGPKVGRNDPCPCGSGKKYKKCCGKE